MGEAVAQGMGRIWTDGTWAGEGQMPRLEAERHRGAPEERATRTRDVEGGTKGRSRDSYRSLSQAFRGPGLHHGVTVGRQEGDQRKTWQLSMAGSSSPRRVLAPQSNFIPDPR